MSNNLEAFLQSIIGASSDAELVSNIVVPRLKDLLREVFIETFNQQLKPEIEDLIRTVVKEVLESKLSVVQRNPEDEMPASNPRILKLKFLEKVSSPVYTGVEIKGESGCPLKVALVDDITGNIVDFGTNAPLEVEIVVLKEDFGAGGNDSWTAKEFIDSIVRERETSNSLRRKASSLLTERVLEKLDKGFGDVHNVKFRHTSNHMKNTKYRLGARVTNPSHGTRIQEAMTEPFLVKDKHLLRNMKYETPSLFDCVSRLVKINRHGPIYRRLREQNVYTVEDFLILHLRDPKLLKSMFSMKPSDLEETLNNAKRCISNKIYCHTDSHQNTGVVFNIFGHVLGLILQSQYVHADNLSQDAKANAPKFLESACEHWGEVECFDDQTSLLQKFPNKLSSSTSFSNSAGIDMIEELYQQNVVVHINDDGAGSSANFFGSTTCPRNIDELILLPIDCSSNEPQDGTLCKEKVWKNWKILVNVAKWRSIITQRRGVAVMEVHVQKKPRHS